MFKNLLLALLSGFLLALAWPTYGFSLFIFFGFVPLLILENNIRKSNSRYIKLTVFFYSFLSFLIWNTITTWWIWNATPFGGIFAIVVNSLLMSTVFLFYHLIAKRKPQSYSLLFLVTFWIAFEKFHHNWDFSWPWLSLGNVFSENYQWIQWYEYTGIFGGTLWIWMVNIIFYSATLHYFENKETRNAIRKVILGISFIVIGIVFSLLILNSYTEKGTKITAVALQPATNPYTEKYHQSHEQIADELLALATPLMDNEVSFVLAPETVFSNRSSLSEFENSLAFQKLQLFENQFPNNSLLVGYDQIEIYPNTIEKTPTGNTFRNNTSFWYESYNSALFLTFNRQPEVYHKSKLVVGVEHFPFRPILEPLLGNALIDLGGSISTLTPQKEVSVFKNNDNVTIAPIICYESIYGEHVSKYVRKGAQVLGIITNDSWWGNTQGHKQLLSYARLLAVEHRRPIIRSANSGISALINQKGEITKRLGYEVPGALKGEVITNDKMTFYSKYGDYIARIATLVAGLLLLAGILGNRKKI